MPQTRWNKGKAPVNADAWNLTPDLATLIDTLGAIAPVASQAERDGLAPPQGKFPAMAAGRTDVPGVALELYDGTNWNRILGIVAQANSQYIGSGMALNAFMTGTSRLMLQVGTFVGPTDASGYIVVGYPAAFPNGVIAPFVVNGDGSVSRKAMMAIQGSPFTADLTKFYISVVDSTTGAAITSTTFRFNWFALGW